MKLTYFNAPERAWTIRICLKIGNFQFDDVFLTEAELLIQKGPNGFSEDNGVPLGQVIDCPVLKSRFIRDVLSMF